MRDLKWPGGWALWQTWDRCLTAVWYCSVNSRHQMIQFKVIHHLHYTKTNCTKFSLLFHHCVTGARSQRIQLLMLFGFALQCWDFGQAFNRPLMPDVELAIFGFSQHTSSLPKTLQKALTLGMIVTKRLILKNWKSSSPPSFWIWIMDMITVIQM